MLIEPASNVSVPLTVVMRTWVKVSDRVFIPAPKLVDATPVRLVTEVIAHVFEPIKLIVIAPFCASAATIAFLSVAPELHAAAPVEAEVTVEVDPVYPDVSTPLNRPIEE